MANENDVWRFIDQCGSKLSVLVKDGEMWLLASDDVSDCGLTMSNETVRELRDFLTAKLEGDDGDTDK